MRMKRNMEDKAGRVRLHYDALEYLKNRHDTPEARRTP